MTIARPTPRQARSPEAAGGQCCLRDQRVEPDQNRWTVTYAEYLSAHPSGDVRTTVPA
jgi:hypothetical protein